MKRLLMMSLISTAKSGKLVATIHSNMCEKFYLIAGTPLESYKLQHNDETSIDVIVKNYKNWEISSEAPNRRAFNDYSERK